MDRMVASVDFQQTLLGLVGFDPSGREQGRDGSALLRGEDPDWEDAAYIHHPSHQWAGVYTDRHLYAAHSTGYTVLFDRKEDPDQIRNLADGAPGVMQGLRKGVARHLESCEAPQADWFC